MLLFSHLVAVDRLLLSANCQLIVNQLLFRLSGDCWDFTENSVKFAQFKIDTSDFLAHQPQPFETFLPGTMLGRGGLRLREGPGWM
jgi:hypothetical protein